LLREECDSWWGEDLTTNAMKRRGEKINAKATIESRETTPI
jgi:hypothetical protein